MDLRWLIIPIMMFVSVRISWAENVKDGKPLRTIAGKNWDWQQIKPGQVVLWHIWCPHCPPAIRAIPKLRNLHKKYHKDGLIIVAVTIKRGENFPPLRPDVLRLRKRLAMPYVILLTTPQHAVFQRYPLNVFPTTYLLDAQGKILHTFLGKPSPKEWTQLETRIQHILGK